MPRLFRYRRPSVKTMLGVTKAKKRANKALGITAVKRPFRAPGNAKRRILRKAGYYKRTNEVSACRGAYYEEAVAYCQNVR